MPATPQATTEPAPTTQENVMEIDENIEGGNTNMEEEFLLFLSQKT